MVVVGSGIGWMASSGVLDAHPKLAAYLAPCKNAPRTSALTPD